MKLTEAHIIKAGGFYYIDKFKVQYIILNIDELKKLKFYNHGKGFNVYVVEMQQTKTTIGNYTCSVQLTTIKYLFKFWLLLFLLKG